jgi:hypothetical protein
MLASPGAITSEEVTREIHHRFCTVVSNWHLGVIMSPFLLLFGTGRIRDHRTADIKNRG